MFVFAPPLLPHVRLALRKEDSVETPLGRFQVRAARRIGRALARRLRALAGEANFTDVLAALEQGSVERILEALNLTVLTGAVEDAQASVAELVITGADIGRRDLPLAVRAQLPSSTQIVSAFIEPMIAARGAELVRLVTESQRKTIQAIIAESFRLGRPLTETATEIMQTVGLLPQHAKAVQRLRATLLEQGATASRAATTAQGYANRLLRVRAMNIARTESMMALSAGQQEAWDVADQANLIDGATAQRVWTVFRPCPFICAPIPARGPVGLREPFVDGRGFTVMMPPAHPSCFPGDSLVSTKGVSAVSKRWYDGDLIIISTARGYDLTCTPNHPILTEYGWVPAACLQVGGHVISTCLGQGESSAVDMYGQDGPTPIHEVAKTFARSRQVSAMPVPVSTPDFHGDGEGSKVAIIWANRLLRENLYSSFLKHLSQSFFLSGNANFMYFSAFCSLDKLIQWRVSPLGCSVGSFGIPLMKTWRARICQQFVRFLLRAERYAMVPEAGYNCCPAYVIGPGQAGLRFASEIPLDKSFFRERQLFTSRRRPFSRGNSKDLAFISEKPSAFQDVFQPRVWEAETAGNVHRSLSSAIGRDHILNIGHVNFSGHVYNLETKDKFYLSESVAVHNCRCVVNLILPSEEA